jgi:hypothetical protein
LLGLAHAGYVGEGDCRLVPHEHTRAALPEGERLIVRPLGLAHHEQQHGAEEDQRQQVHEQPKPVAELRGIVDYDVHAVELLGCHAIVFQHLADRGVVLFARRIALPVGLLEGELVLGDGNLADGALAHPGGDLVHRHHGAFLLVGARRDRDEEGDHRYQDDQVDEAIAEPLGIHTTVLQRASKAGRCREVVGAERLTDSVGVSAALATLDRMRVDAHLGHYSRPPLTLQLIA